MSENLRELPMITPASYGATTTAVDYDISVSDSFAPRNVSIFDTSKPWIQPDWDNVVDTTKLFENIDKDTIGKLKAEIKILKAKLKGESTVSRRLVKVIIVDPNENLSLEDAILVNEVERFTDLEDNELFFDMDIKGVLDKHNVKRENIVDKKASKSKDKDVYLEPIKVRDLKMSVITIAEF